jgi:flavin-dependent dehydrogenase
MDYDLITVGGGLAGAALAKALAERGARVLVLERETRFRDRVRGEAMHPWGGLASVVRTGRDWAMAGSLARASYSAGVA